MTIDDLALLIHEEFQNVYKRLDAIEHRLDAVEHRLNALERRFDLLEVRMTNVERPMDLLAGECLRLVKNTGP